MRKSSIPSIIQLAGVSPGCTRAEKNRAGFSLGLVKLLFFIRGFDGVFLDDENDDGRGGVDDREEE